MPFFWSEQFDLFLQYVGYAASWDELIVHGDLPGRNFLAFYVKGNRVMAAAGLQRDRQLAALAELMRLDRRRRRRNCAGTRSSIPGRT